MFDAPDLEQAVIDRLNDRNANLYEKILKSPKKELNYLAISIKRKMTFSRSMRFLTRPTGIRKLCLTHRLIG